MAIFLQRIAKTIRFFYVIAQHAALYAERFSGNLDHGIHGREAEPEERVRIGQALGPDHANLDYTTVSHVLDQRYESAIGKIYVFDQLTRAIDDLLTLDLDELQIWT